MDVSYSVGNIKKNSRTSTISVKKGEHQSMELISVACHNLLITVILLLDNRRYSSLSKSITTAITACLNGHCNKVKKYKELLNANGIQADQAINRTTPQSRAQLQIALYPSPHI